MCMSCNKSGPKANAYSPKKASAKSGSKSGYKPTGMQATMSSFGKPSVRVSFSGKK